MQPEFRTSHGRWLDVFEKENVAATVKGSGWTPSDLSRSSSCNTWKIINVIKAMAGGFQWASVVAVSPWAAEGSGRRALQPCQWQEKVAPVGPRMLACGRKPNIGRQQLRSDRSWSWNLDYLVCHRVPAMAARLWIAEGRGLYKRSWVVETVASSFRFQSVRVGIMILGYGFPSSWLPFSAPAQSRAIPVLLDPVPLFDHCRSPEPKPSRRKLRPVARVRRRCQAGRDRRAWWLSGSMGGGSARVFLAWREESGGEGEVDSAQVDFGFARSNLGPFQF
ncbi:hypothetical protein CDL15_Pgr013247 [Punica granatum]|uniref:Uncharacterized protein n=1 Tax=Punica granatum TaxID=22663 RepID=A0A218WP03_PUNGR|nr:hypothetical protein CDL15_Pgr013247 [Punica granatum]